jgi:predicted CoA-binding protein
MLSNYETFFDLSSFAVIGRSEAKPFPVLSYRGLKSHGKIVYPVDPGAERVDGDTAYPNLSALPEPVEGMIIEVPKHETRQWVAAAADAGIRHIWVHMGHETPEAVAVAKEKGVNLRTGSCAVMYLAPNLSYHGVHKAVWKLMGKY